MNDGQNQLSEAKRFLRLALSKSGHDESCALLNFQRHNKHLPPNHPGWKYQPDCNCWYAAARDFAKP